MLKDIPMLRGAPGAGVAAERPRLGLGPCRPQGLKWSDGALQHYRQTDPSLSLPCITSGDPRVIQQKQIPPFGLVQRHQTSAAHWLSQQPTEI